MKSVVAISVGLAMCIMGYFLFGRSATVQITPAQADIREGQIAVFRFKNDYALLAVQGGPGKRTFLLSCFDSADFSRNPVSLAEGTVSTKQTVITPWGHRVDLCDYGPVHIQFDFDVEGAVGIWGGSDPRAIELSKIEFKENIPVDFKRATKQLIEGNSSATP